MGRWVGGWGGWCAILVPNPTPADPWRAPACPQSTNSHWPPPKLPALCTCGSVIPLPGPYLYGGVRQLVCNPVALALRRLLVARRKPCLLDRPVDGRRRKRRGGGAGAGAEAREGHRQASAGGAGGERAGAGSRGGAVGAAQWGRRRGGGGRLKRGAWRRSGASESEGAVPYGAGADAAHAVR